MSTIAFLNIGMHGYISPTARLADGRSHLDRTTQAVIEIVRRECAAWTARDAAT
ncbi:hypothetical protein GCM10027063_49710 [Promicromonospora xylanilytica]